MTERLHSLTHLCFHLWNWGFPGTPDCKEFACNVADQGLILGQEDSLEKGLATHSRVLALRISWTEEPGGLESMSLQRVRHD